MFISMEKHVSYMNDEQLTEPGKAIAIGAE